MQHQSKIQIAYTYSACCLSAIIYSCSYQFSRNMYRRIVAYTADQYSRQVFVELI